MPDRPHPDHTRGGHEEKKAPITPSGFGALELRPELLRSITKLGWNNPSQIQQELIPQVLAGHDVLGIAQTGTGKTGAFAIPILQMLAGRPPAKPGHPYAVILAPTRELVQQIEQQFIELGRDLRLRTVSVFGGVSDRPQISALNAGVEVVVAAPGRLLDIMGQGWIDFAQLTHCVLDEADRMLDMGFIRDIRRILNRMPARKQMLLLSATLPGEIKDLVHEFLYQPREVHIGVSGPPKELSHKILEVHGEDKPDALGQILRGDYESILIFTRTKHGADKLARKLARERGESLAVLHADRSQAQRDTALARFRSGAARTLVATDVASRGIDVVGIELVVNYDVPRDPEDYVHRVGRTARAKRAGLALTLCTPEETKYLRKVEQLIGHRIERMQLQGGSGRAAGAAEPDAAAAEARPARARNEAPAEAPADGARGGRGRGRGRAGTEDAAPVLRPGPADVPVVPRGRARREEQPERPRREPRGGREAFAAQDGGRPRREQPESSYVEDHEIVPTWDTAHLRRDVPLAEDYRLEDMSSGGDRSGRAGRGGGAGAPDENRGRGRGARRDGSELHGASKAERAPTKVDRGRDRSARPDRPLAASERPGDAADSRSGRGPAGGDSAERGRGGRGGAAGSGRGRGGSAESRPAEQRPVEQRPADSAPRERRSSAPPADAAAAGSPDGGPRRRGRRGGRGRGGRGRGDGGGPAAPAE